MAEDEKTAEETIKEERCAIPRELYNDIAAIATATKKTHCEIKACGPER
jgi:hypothetical protein